MTAFIRRHSLAAILSLSVALRLLAALYLGNEVVVLPGTYDQLSYHILALRLLDGHGFTFGERWWPLTAAGTPTAHWSYLYTFYLTALYALFGPNPLVARLFQATLVGILQPYLAFRLGRLVADERAALAAAGLTAIYAYFIYYAATLMTEPLFITAVLATLFFLLRLAETEGKERWTLAVALGLVAGAAILLRQLFLLFLPFLFLWLGWGAYRRRRALPLGPALLAGMIVLLMILPFSFYNYLRFERFVLLNTNAGYALFWANHPIHGTHFDPIISPEGGSYEGLIPRELRGLDEVALEQALMGQAVRFVLDDPGRYLLLSLSRIPAYFMFWPSPDSGLASNLARVGSFGLMLPLMLYGLYRVLFRHGAGRSLLQPASLLLLFAAAYTLLHLLSWALIRYRLPVDAILLLFAGEGLAAMLRMARSRGRWFTKSVTPDHNFT